MARPRYNPPDSTPKRLAMRDGVASREVPCSCCWIMTHSNGVTKSAPKVPPPMAPLISRAAELKLQPPPPLFIRPATANWSAISDDSFNRLTPQPRNSSDGRTWAEASPRQGWRTPHPKSRFLRRSCPPSRAVRTLCLRREVAERAETSNLGLPSEATRGAPRDPAHANHSPSQRGSSNMVVTTSQQNKSSQTHIDTRTDTQTEMRPPPEASRQGHPKPWPASCAQDCGGQVQFGPRDQSIGVTVVQTDTKPWASAPSLAESPMLSRVGSVACRRTRGMRMSDSSCSDRSSLVLGAVGTEAPKVENVAEEEPDEGGRAEDIGGEKAGGQRRLGLHELGDLGVHLQQQTGG
eukprot:scaffold27508_cov101-Isochrysis_galbana.AAC.1